MSTWADPLKHVLTGLKLGSVDAGSFVIEVEELRKPETVRRRAELGHAAGWGMCPDACTWREHPFDPGERVLLAGEWSHGDGSLHLRQEREGWVLVTLRRAADGALNGVVLEDRFLGWHGTPVLRYETWWRPDGDRGLRRAASRLVAIEEEEHRGA